MAKYPDLTEPPQMAGTGVFLFSASLALWFHSVQLQFGTTRGDRVTNSILTTGEFAAMGSLI